MYIVWSLKQHCTCFSASSWRAGVIFLCMNYLCHKWPAPLLQRYKKTLAGMWESAFRHTVVVAVCAQAVRSACTVTLLWGWLEMNPWIGHTLLQVWTFPLIESIVFYLLSILFEYSCAHACVIICDLNVASITSYWTVFWLNPMKKKEYQLSGADRSAHLLPSVSSQVVSCTHRSSHVEVKGYGLLHHPHPAASCCHGRHFHWAHVPAGHRLWTRCVAQHWHHLHNRSDSLANAHHSKMISLCVGFRRMTYKCHI